MVAADSNQVKPTNWFGVVLKLSTYLLIVIGGRERCVAVERPKPPNRLAVYGEVVGPGVSLLSLVLEFRALEVKYGYREHFSLLASAGLSLFPYPQNTYYPLCGKVTYGIENQNIEFLCGISILKQYNRFSTLIKPPLSDSPYLLCYGVLYRFEGPNGTLFRAGYSPIYDPDSKFLYHFLSISFGWSFLKW